jgi:hypothetical protein
MRPENDVYRRRYNNELNKEFSSPNALNVTKSDCATLVTPLIRRPEDLPQKALFRAIANGRRSRKTDI